MDPLTQGLLGAAAAQVVLGRRLGHRAWIAGMAGGMLPDADVLLQPLADPALPWSLHRHFTHALIMVPVMGLLAALPLLLSRSMRAAPKLVIGAATLGALTHGPLDWCTSYGTKILWPFSFRDWTIDLYPIVDPLFSILLLVSILLATRRRSVAHVAFFVIFLGCYTGVAVHQRSRARAAQSTIVAHRGHADAWTRGRVMPLPGSLLAWRSLYVADGVIHADGIRVPPFGGLDDVTWEPGGAAPVATLEEGLRKKAPSASTERVIDVWDRFTGFADGYVAWAPDDARLLGDMRISTSLGMEPIWGIRLAEDGVVRWVMPERDRGASLTALWSAITGTAEGLRALPLAKKR